MNSNLIKQKKIKNTELKTPICCFSSQKIFLNVENPIYLIGTDQGYTICLMYHPNAGFPTELHNVIKITVIYSLDVINEGEETKTFLYIHLLSKMT